MTSSRAREFAALLVGFGTALSGCVIDRSELEAGDAFTTEDAGRDARVSNDVSGDAPGDMGMDVGSDVGTDGGSDVGTDAPMTTPYIAWWRFGADPLVDSSGNLHTLVQTRGASDQVTFSGGTARFEAREGLRAPNDRLDGVVAVSLLVQPTALPSGSDRSAVLTSNNRLSIAVNAMGAITCGFPGRESVASRANPTRPDVATAVVCTYDGANLVLRTTDGMEDTAMSPAAPPGASSDDYVLGGGSGGSVFAGDVRDVRLWNRSPTAEEITAFFATR